MRILPSFVLLVAVACIPSTGSQTRPAPNATTSSRLTPGDLRTRLFAIAHDSMMGRAPGDPGNFKATEYIAAEFARVGLKPAGDNGGWLQILPFYRRTADRKDVLRVDNEVARLGLDYAPSAGNARYRPVDGVSVVYAGLASDSTTWIDAGAAQGKALLFSVIPPERRTQATRRTPIGQLQNSPRFRGAATILVAELDAAGASTAAAMLTGAMVLDTTWRDVPPTVLVTNTFAAKLLGRSLEGAASGTAGKTLHGGRRVIGVPSFTAT